MYTQVEIQTLWTGRIVQQPVALCSALVVAMTAVSGIVLLLATMGVPPDVLLRDVNATAGLPPHYGLLSMVGNFGWLAAAAVSLHTWSVMHETCSDRMMLRVILLGGLWCAAAAMDDAFLLHEWVAPAMGIPEVVVLAAHAGMALVFLRAARDVLARSEWLLLLPAFGGLGLSILVDLFGSGGFAHAVEDLAKLGGITFLAAYLMRASAQLLSSRSGP